MPGRGPRQTGAVLSGGRPARRPGLPGREGFPSRPLRPNGGEVALPDAERFQQEHGIRERYYTKSRVPAPRLPRLGYRIRHRYTKVGDYFLLKIIHAKLCRCSMMAAKAGAKMVSACDFNETLFSLSRDIVVANELGGQVNIIYALSTSLNVPRDLPSRFVVLALL